MPSFWMYTILGACLIGTGGIQGSPIKMLPASISATQFSVDLFKKIISRPDENVLISPLSVWEACLLAYYGAAGSTEGELNKLLYLTDRKKPEALASVKKLTDSLESKNTKEFDFTTANRIYLDKTLPEPVNKQELVSEGKLVKIDLKKSPQNEINKWVNDVTKGKIKSIFPGPLPANSRMVIVSTFYMKGIWEYVFDPKDTRKGDFHVSAKKTVKVQFMRQTQNFYRASSTELKAEVLQMPYRSKSISMYVFLPEDKKVNVKKMAEKISPTFISGLGLYWAQTDVVLPKFKIEQATDLNEPLTKIGAQKMFHSSDFTGFTKFSSLSVSEVKQKSFIEVNEQGTEAAAVTNIVVAGSAAPKSPPFICDRPFMFAIHDDINRVPLFIGIVTDPSIS